LLEAEGFFPEVEHPNLMKLRVAGTANRRILNIEPPFDPPAAEHSLFDIQYSPFQRTVL